MWLIQFSFFSFYHWDIVSCASFSCQSADNHVSCLSICAVIYYVPASHALVGPHSVSRMIGELTHPLPPHPPKSDTFKKNCTSLLKFFYPAVIVSSRWENLTIPAWTRSHWFDTGIMRSINAVAVHSVWPLNQWTRPTPQAAFWQQLHKHLF